MFWAKVTKMAVRLSNFYCFLQETFEPIEDDEDGMPELEYFDEVSIE